MMSKYSPFAFLFFSALVVCQPSFAEFPSPHPEEHPAYTLPVAEPSPDPEGPIVSVLSGNVLEAEEACAEIFPDRPPKFAGPPSDQDGCRPRTPNDCYGVQDIPDSQPHLSPLEMSCMLNAWRGVGTNDENFHCSSGNACLSYIVSYTCLSPNDGQTPDQRRSAVFDRRETCGDVMVKALEICRTGCTNGAYAVNNCNVTVTD